MTVPSPLGDIDLIWRSPVSFIYRPIDDCHMTVRAGELNIATSPGRTFLGSVFGVQPAGVAAWTHAKDPQLASELAFRRKLIA